ncbi:MAG: hypothetical protein QME55_09035, partial [Brevundimonas sp.]|nr:hypothetical protein [Brevundimonas sp.]
EQPVKEVKAKTEKAKKENDSASPEELPEGLITIDDFAKVQLRVAEVVASPIDRALNQCWPWGDPEIAPQLHQQWAAAIETALISPGVTMGVAPIRLLAEEGGVLDGLEARGFEVDGPEWRAEAPAAVAPDVDEVDSEKGV